MESLLREPLLPEIGSFLQEAFPSSGSLALFPVRHHSPACAHHLLKTIESWRPDAILIEGPSDAAHLLPFMANSGTVPPFCIYYSYDDRQQLVSDAAEKYRAYYPFLAYSPEWVAVVEGAARGIATAFIDLPYAAALVNRGGTAGVQRSLLGDEQYEVNRYTAQLAAKSGCRSFAEFWESRFELDAQQRSTEEFVKGVLSLGFFMREATPRDEDFAANCRRERYMAGQIAKARQAGGRVLVVAGAFHIRGLLEELRAPTAEPLLPHDTAAVASYLMPYTFAEADTKSGYSSGMPFPAFYQSVWEKLKKGEQDAFGSTILEYIVKTARYIRRTQPISLPDEINALQMAKSLAALRDKPSPGVWELLDGVRSTFVKGDINSTATFELDFLLRQLTGMGAGSVMVGSCIPPVVADYYALCRKHRIKTGTVERQELTLDIVKNPAHYQKSRFLHQMLFLETGFCQLQSGPDYVSGRDKNLVRESWVCRCGTQVEVRLTDLSVYGATLGQVCSSLIKKRFCDSMVAQELGKLLLSVQVMGITDFYSVYEEQIYTVIENEHNFESLGKLIGSLRYLSYMQQMLEGQVADELPALCRAAFRAAVALIPLVRRVSAEREQAVCECLRNLFALTVEAPQWCAQELLALQLAAALEDGFCNIRFYGAALAIQHRMGGVDEETLCAHIFTYLESSPQANQAASFLCGVFLAARDVLFANEAVLARIDSTIARMGQETFLEVLPNLRYAFTSFLPAEIDRIGRMAAGLHGAGELPYTAGGVAKAELIDGMRRDAFAAAELAKWGLV